MSPDQLRLYNSKSADCLFPGYVDEDDRHCNDMGMAPIGYDTISEDSSNIGNWLAEVRWVDIQDVRAQDIPVPKLPPYVPTITKGSARLFEKYHPSMVAVKLGDVVSPEELRVADSIERRFGIPPGTPVILQSYGKDRLLENIWPHRHKIFAELAKLGFSAVTGLNYSVWHSQSHAERLINIKRAHLTYEELQKLGMPAIPHMYWSGHINLDAWLLWLERNPTVKVMAIDMQTMRTESYWSRAVADLEYFVDKLARPIHFLITGPYAPLRIAQLKKLLPSMTLTNGTPARSAFARQEMSIKGLRIARTNSDLDKGILLQQNVQLYHDMMQPKNAIHHQKPLSRFHGKQSGGSMAVRKTKIVGKMTTHRR